MIHEQRPEAAVARLSVLCLGHRRSNSPAATPARHVAAAVRGRPMDPDWFLALALEHLEAVHRLAVLLRPRAADAADLTMKTYTIASGAADRFERQQLGLRLWLLKLLAAVYRRTRRSALPRSADGLPFGRDPGPGREGVEGAPDACHPDVAVHRAIVQLPREPQAILLLWSVEGLTCREIAAVLSLPVRAVIRRLDRAKRFVAAAMDRSGSTVPSHPPGPPVRTSARPGERI